jgi:hypothetical protein
MNTAMTKQSGITFGGFLVGIFLLITLSLFGFKLIPAYMEEAKIQHLFETITMDPEMLKASVEGVNAVKSADIEVTLAEGGRPILTASYEVKIKLVGNATLLLDFNPSSAGK